MEKFTFKKVNTNNLDGIVRTHKASFKDYFLTNLGEKFLYRFYRELLQDKETVATAAFDRDILVGFIVCTKNKANVMGNFYARNIGWLAGSILVQLIKGNKVILKGLFSRLRTAGAILSLLMGKWVHVHGQEKNAVRGSTENIRLLSIAVDPQYRGTGVSEQLMSYFHRSLKEEEVHAVGLSVHRENGRAIGFYNKMGWKIEREEKNAIYLIKNL